ncbi:hypothetical protein [Citrobacter portucalensis]|uniref:hypothetical protein n=1 Tax=Citrobacter portucalensis TaxID=1639133 RepID=UPI00226BBA24|nr:hypothetical protein [Citrobacter portucalensis]MCX9024042.1 hypothetical protein [Citrobacter portucalensis]
MEALFRTAQSGDATSTRQLPTFEQTTENQRRETEVAGFTIRPLRLISTRIPSSITTGEEKLTKTILLTELSSPRLVPAHHLMIMQINTISDIK